MRFAQSSRTNMPSCDTNARLWHVGSQGERGGKVFGGFVELSEVSQCRAKVSLYLGIIAKLFAHLFSELCGLLALMVVEQLSMDFDGVLGCRVGAIFFHRTGDLELFCGFPFVYLHGVVARAGGTGVQDSFTPERNNGDE